MEIIIRTDHFPVTASWNREKFASDDRLSGSVFTSINPGGWFDTGSVSDLGIVILSKQDLVTFSSNIEGEYSDAYGYIHRDTMPSYWFRFASKDFVVNVHDPILNEQISIYPNPAGDYIMIENGSDKKIEEIAIFNNHGQLVGFSSEEKISLNYQSPGIYFLQIKTGDGRFVTKKVVKK